MNYLKFNIPTLTIFAFALFMGENVSSQPIHVEIFETSEAGNQLTPIQTVRLNKRNLYAYISLHPTNRFQKITGFGGSFTQASASLLNQLSEANRKKILDAYFSEKGANYSLTRTHINSCDFSTHNYAYNNTPGDTLLNQFDISEDEKGIIPMIQEAKKISKEGFKIIASPWTAPPWMKTNNSWKGGKLLPQYNKTWARYFEKYMKAYGQKGIDIWGITVENEPLGNDNNWESMLFSPEEMSDFVGNYLGPHLKESGLKEVVILGYDQNRGDELKKWADAMYKNPLAAQYFGGTAVHWYASTYHVFEESLNYTHQLAPTKHLINTEACVDAEVPKWKDDKWYWQKEATDWGWDWASEKDKYLHPKYAPVFRYAGDIIGCLNNNVDGWVDWNMVLNKQGGPNWFKNWCVAPVIVDEKADEVYFTPLYYTMAHFSKFIRPGAQRIGFTKTDDDLLVTAAENPDGSYAVVVFNPTSKVKIIQLALNKISFQFNIAAKAIQTIVLKK